MIRKGRSLALSRFGFADDKIVFGPFKERENVRSAGSSLQPLRNECDSLYPSYKVDPADMRERIWAFAMRLILCSF
jgi:hypothetical protein